MNWDRVMNTIGFGLVALCFVWASTRIFSRARAEADPDRVIIRMAHWQLESGIREALDELIRQYEEMHPNVRVEQMLIPERVYANWLITQLVGGTAPDLIEIGRPMSDERKARYFTPLMDIVSKSNPYNVGTELEGMPWRDTFMDGLAGPPSYQAGLLDYYGVPTAMFTIRLYYNVDLYREIAGDAPLPRTFEELIALCERVHEYAAEHNVSMIPIAGSQYNAPFIIFNLWSSMTQRMAQQMVPTRTLHFHGEQAWIRYLQNDWSYASTPIQIALSVMRRVGQHMQSGFLSLGRDDAMFYFVQGRALMTASGSWDIGSMHAQAPFAIDAFPIPMPNPNHPVYGQYMLGPLSEAGHGAGAAFGLTQQSRHPEQALDFLHFITSQHGNQVFSDISLWLPAVVGVELPEKVRPFELFTEGYPGGMSAVYGADSRRILNNNLHLLLGHDGSPERFSEAMDAGLPGALVEDFRINHTGRIRQWHRNDSLVTTLAMLAFDEQAGDVEERLLIELLESSVDQECLMLWVENRFDSMGLSLAH